MPIVEYALNGSMGCAVAEIKEAAYAAMRPTTTLDALKSIESATIRVSPS
jgi:hypothetical protein